MRRKEHPYDGRRYLVDVNPLSKVIHDLEHEKKSCNIHKIIESHVKMLDTESQVNRLLLLNSDYNLCKCCMPEKYETYNR
ncbi:hypothetical protein R9X47_17745 [Wukongibacter baidiensis]|uniref:hypothetical protein n=1 Tax=Wukongibacter baidiensis TaxID=1723361 RepID=UPI003D7F36E6